ncbi:MAG: hypothetical protein JWN33_554 [Candidatus Saccharibacteria bacterium]|nr:hypothetical protein [Candidatus Saccharibacteria bacterium]
MTEQTEALIIQELAAKQELYEPDLSVQDMLSQKVLTLVIGPTAVGKSTIIERVLARRPSWAIAGTTTTRQRRDGDPANYHTATEGITKEHIIDLIHNGELVNYSVFRTGHIYGTLPEDFVGDVSLLPALPSSIASLGKAGFKRLEQAYVVTSPAPWEHWLNDHERAADNLPKRLHEAVDSLDYALAHKDELHPVLNNEDPGRLEQAAEEIISLTENGDIFIPGSERNRRWALVEELQQYVLQKLVSNSSHG